MLVRWQAANCDVFGRVCAVKLQAYFLVADDMMDQSITRRGQPCWYKVVSCNVLKLAVELYELFADICDASSAGERRQHRHQRLVHARGGYLLPPQEALPSGEVLRQPSRDLPRGAPSSNCFPTSSKADLFPFHSSQTTFQTEMGQLIDLITAPEDSVDLSKFSLDK